MVHQETYDEKEKDVLNAVKLYREAIALFRDDTGAFPCSLADLAAETAPAKGFKHGKPVRIQPASWHGPYIDCVLDDMVYGRPFIYEPRNGTVRAPSHPEW